LYPVKTGELAPPPPPAEEIFEDAFDVRAKIEAAPLLDATPPAPTVTVYDVAGVTVYPVPVRNPPAPPPPPLDWLVVPVAPPPPPPTIK
jgi:hypothetical protein